MYLKVLTRRVPPALQLILPDTEENNHKGINFNTCRGHKRSDSLAYFVRLAWYHHNKSIMKREIAA